MIIYPSNEILWYDSKSQVLRPTSDIGNCLYQC